MLDNPTTAQATGAALAASVPFLVWLKEYLFSFHMQLLLVYIVIGCIGVFGHYLKKYLNGDIEGHFFSYLFKDHVRSTITSFLTFIGSGMAYAFSGSLDTMSWPALIGLAFTTGYAVDSVANKSTPPPFGK